MTHDPTTGEAIEATTAIEVAPPPPIDAVTALRRGLLQLDDQRAAMAQAGDYRNLAFGAADLAAIIADLSAIHRQARLDVARIIAATYEGPGVPKVLIEGLGEVKVPGGNERRGWDSEALLRKLVRELIIDEDGALRYETVTEAADAIVQLVLDVLPVSASTDWKVGQQDKATGEWSGLRGYGIDPADWCSEVAKPRLASIPKRLAS